MENYEIKDGVGIIPDSVTEIRGRAFAGCTDLISVVIPDSVTTIAPEAFLNCTNLTSIVIPDSVTEIGFCAFKCCKGLTSIVIPKSVKKIDSGAFTSTGLEKVTFLGSVKYIGSDSFFGCPPIGFHVPADKIQYYKKQHLREDPWFFHIVPLPAET